MKSKGPAKRFPDPRLATADGLVAVGGDLSAETLMEAYQNGIFPWPQPGMPLLWFSPDPRGVLDFKDLHIPESLKKWAKKNEHWSFTTNRAFTRVIHQCRLQPRPGQDGTWILPEMEDAYTELFRQGKAMSLECWEDDALIGGIYGVLTKTRNNLTLFSGESMFHLKTNASKMCLWKLVEHLQGIGHQWMDIQMTTEVTTAMGGKLISKEQYLQRIGV